MDRVMIIGCGGAGKSTLAREMGAIIGLPVVHLDQIWWSPGDWQHLSREEFDVHLEQEMEKPQWILDGNFNRTLEKRLERCDTVVFLDLPRLVCLKNWLFRVIKNWGHARQDMAKGCVEWFDPEMAGWIWTFNTKNRKRYYALLEQHPEKCVVILRSRKASRNFLEGLKAQTKQ